MVRHIPLLFVLFSVSFVSGAGREPQPDPRLKNAFRKPEQKGWTFVHLQGKPGEIGFQNGFLLAPEIADLQNVAALELEHDSHRPWKFYRNAAESVLWPHVEQEYREELQGIAAGLSARGIQLDLWDVVALNAIMEWPYYTAQQDTLQHPTKPGKTVPPGDHCSAFVATGSYTKDGRPVIAHNNWTNYLDGERWTVVYDITPAHGNKFVMDGLPGVIHSADDFGINAAGLMITETTITAFAGWDSNGIPEFVRARKAMQYANSIDDFAAIMKAGNNGGYANGWLLADRNTGEIASLELGLKNVVLERTRDGYFAGANFPRSEKLAREETTFSVRDIGNSSNARRVRWDALLQENRGKIDVAKAESFLGDHYDSFAKQKSPSERTLCGHVDLSPRGMGDWQSAFGPAGAVQNKVADAAMAERLAFHAHVGHACGISFRASAYLQQHPQFEWQKGLLRDLHARGWTEFQAARLPTGRENR